MDETNSTNQHEKAARIRRKPERASVLRPTFAAARQVTPDRQQRPSSEGGLLQRQCSCGKHTVGGGPCEECQQKGETASPTPAPDDLRLATPSDIPTTRDSSAGFDLSHIPAQTRLSANGQLIQPNLTVNAPGDQYEQEADRVAETVMRMPASPLPAPLSDITSFLQPTVSHLPSISRIQASGGNGAFQAPVQVEAQINQMRGGGQPLPAAEQRFFAERMGYDFSGVRVHTDANAIQASRGIQAHAFTMGNNIAFNAGAYRPGTDAGRRLLAHELTHVVQQGQGGIQNQASPKLQREAWIQMQTNSKIIQRVDLGMSVSQNVADGPYGWMSNYELEITDDHCLITINVKINPDPDVTAKDVARVQSVTSNEFARYFDRRFNLIDDTGNQLPLEVRLSFVDSGEHLSVDLHSGSGRDDLSNWFVNSEPIDRAHELGHQLGLRDEYVDATVADRANAGSPGVSHDDSLMGNYYDDGIPEADVRQRHGDQLASDISAATGMSFTAEFSDTYIVRRGDTLSGIALRIYGDANKWHDIYDLNQDKIENPDLIFPDQELRLPPRTP